MKAKKPNKKICTKEMGQGERYNIKLWQSGFGKDLGIGVLVEENNIIKMHRIKKLNKKICKEGMIWKPLKVYREQRYVTIIIEYKTCKHVKFVRNLLIQVLRF